jgi:hypothetical protein
MFARRAEDSMRESKLPPLKERIAAAIKANAPTSATPWKMDYYACLHAVFPHEHFPKAFRYQQNGGPPGCAMAFGRAIREMRAHEWRDDDGSRWVALPRGDQ